MVFSKLFKKNKMPKNSGNEDGDAEFTLVTKYYLNGKSIKGKPLYELTSEHIIGSEEGDIIIDDKNISSKHLQINLDQGVVTIMDLGSEKGTKVGKKDIEPGKKVILRDGDDVRLGKLKLIFEEVEEEVPIMNSGGGLSAEDKTGEVDTAGFEPEETAETTTEAPAEETPPEAPQEAPKTPPESEELTLEAPAAKEEEPADLSEEEAPKEDGLNVDTSIIKNGPVEDEDENREKTFKLQLYNYTDSELDDSSSNEDEKKNNLKAINLRKLNKQKTKTKGVSVGPSANAIVRLLGLITDIVLFSILLLFLPQKQLILKYIDKGITKGLDFIVPLFKTHALKYVDMAYKEVPALAKIQEEIVKNYKDEYFIYIQYIIFFMAFQMIMTLLFGVTIGQFLFGMKAYGNFVIKRFLGPLRVFLNYLFVPFFWLFELPTIFSKRSFKEVLSFTQVIFISKARLFSSIFILYPLLGLGLITAPLFEDMTIPKAIKVETNKDFKIVKNETQYNHHSDSLNLSLVSNENMIYLPQIKVVQIDGKKIIQIGYRAIIKSESVVVSYELLKAKKINFQKFFGQFTKLNPLVYSKHKTILDVVHDASNDNPNFKSKNFPTADFAKEVEHVLKGALTFSIDDPNLAIDFLIKYGPFFIGHMDVRKKVLELVDNPVSKIDIRQVGSSFAMVLYTETGKKKFLSILPLNGLKSYVYKIRYEEEKDLSEIFKLDLNRKNNNLSNDITSDFLNLVVSKKREKVDEKLQSLYEYLMSFASLCLLEGDEKSLAILQTSIRDILELLESNKETVKFNQPRANKLKQNLNDLLQAIIDKDSKFFNIKKTKTV